MKGHDGVKRISKRECGRLIRGKMGKIETKEKDKLLIYDRIQELLN